MYSLILNMEIQMLKGNMTVWYQGSHKYFTAIGFINICTSSWDLGFNGCRFNENSGRAMV